MQYALGLQKQRLRARASTGWRWLLLVNAVVLSVLVWAFYLHSSNPDLYYRNLQEDEALEWASFWAFFLAAVVGAWAALRRRRATGEFPWFLLGVSLFCFVVAMEEISWAQRILGYRPPDYFLANNFQQELNVHNVIDTGWRKLMVKAITLGYGVVLPVLWIVSEVRRPLARLGVVAPPLALAPSFLAAFLLYEIYPWKFSGEVMELMLGFCFLFALLHPWSRQQPETDRGSRGRPVVAAALSTIVVLSLGYGSAGASRRQRDSHPGNIEAAEKETQALRRDFRTMASNRSALVATKCGLHKRIYSYLEKYEEEYLLRGGYSALVSQGLPEERAAFFIDPWNSPYWIRHECKSRTRSLRLFVYSFGPNRRRDSSEWEILGDDVGSVIAAVGPIP